MWPGVNIKFSSQYHDLAIHVYSITTSSTSIMHWAASESFSGVPVLLLTAAVGWISTALCFFYEQFKIMVLYLPRRVYLIALIFSRALPRLILLYI